MTAKPMVHEFGMGVDVHGDDPTTAACRAVSDAIRHSSLPFFREVRERGGKMLVAVRPVEGGLRVPGSDTIIACVGITVSVDG